jgi:hypothetical protein
MNIVNDIITTIFSNPVYSAILFMTIITAIFGYIALTAKVVKDKPHSHSDK